MVDKDGTWLTPNQILALTLYHLKKNRRWTGAAVRTVPTSHMIDAIAAHLRVPLHETPVGFKYIGALMESEPIIVGGEESGGLSVKGHVPEKDGILACLLMAELVAVERKPLGKILKQLENTSVNSTPTASTSTSIPRKKPLCSIDWRRVWTRSAPLPCRSLSPPTAINFSYPRRMGCLPRQRHRTSGSLLPRDQKCGADENAQKRLSEDLEIGTETPTPSA